MSASESANYWYDEKEFKIKSADPNLWIKFWVPDIRRKSGAEFVLQIDDRSLGFAIAELQAEVAESASKDPSTKWPVYTFTLFGIPVVRSDIISGYKTRTSAATFSSREQQERALEFIRQGFKVFDPHRGTRLENPEITGAIVRFTPELEKKFDAGDFIE